MSATVFETANADEDSIFHSSAKGFSDAATDARAAAKIAAQNVKDGVGQGVYKAAFGLSFGVVFTGVFLTELLPTHNVVRRGLEDGADAALDAIDERKDRRSTPTRGERLPKQTAPRSTSRRTTERKPGVKTKETTVKSKPSRTRIPS